MFNLYGVDAATEERWLIGGGYKERAEAEAQAKAELKAFPKSGHDEMHGFWWGRDAEGNEFRFVVDGA